MRDIRYDRNVGDWQETVSARAYATGTSVTPVLYRES